MCLPACHGASLCARSAAPSESPLPAGGIGRDQPAEALDGISERAIVLFARHVARIRNLSAHVSNCISALCDISLLRNTGVVIRHWRFEACMAGERLAKFPPMRRHSCDCSHCELWRDVTGKPCYPVASQCLVAWSGPANLLRRSGSSEPVLTGARGSAGPPALNGRGRGRVTLAAASANSPPVRSHRRFLYRCHRQAVMPA